MTPHQIDAVTNALINIHDFIQTHWPTLATASAAPAIWLAGQHHRRRRHIRRGIRRLNQYANHPASRAVLDDFHQPRKEQQ